MAKHEDTCFKQLFAVVYDNALLFIGIFQCWCSIYCFHTQAAERPVQPPGARGCLTASFFNRPQVGVVAVSSPLQMMVLHN